MKVSTILLFLLVFTLPGESQETLRLDPDKSTIPLRSHNAFELLRHPDLPAIFTADTGARSLSERYNISLFLIPDSSYIRTTTVSSASIDTPDTIVDMGVWSVSNNESLLILSDGLSNPRRLVIRNNDLLIQKTTSRSGENRDMFEFHRTERTEIFTPRTIMSGMYSYMADAGVFRECRTGKPWPVAVEEDNILLENAYMDQNPAMMEELFVSFSGRLEFRFPMEGNKKKIFVIVEGFDSIFPDRRCNVMIGMDINQ